MAEIPEDVKRTLHQVIESYEMQLDVDPNGTAGMGGPTESEVEELRDWIENEL